ncbi:MAG TPA: sigma factor-like helix-turn-helix DNA-binding protein, partial [Solirubrobacteraceae bacterium]|nr:sigma factor-like helix-turn-helix DNA-binding protein [Solirubrobacteraceae bacterium]
MASLNSLPADQRAVIQLVVQQRRSYDEIAAMLSIDRAGVRQRALDAFDALGPENSIPAPQRALLTDYLLGQLPHRVADQVHDGIADSPAERAWLRVIASEVTGVATVELPPIPPPGAVRGARVATGTAGAGRTAGTGWTAGAAAAAAAGAGEAADADAEDFTDQSAAAQPPARRERPARKDPGQQARPAPVAAPAPRPKRSAAGSSRR